ncbi:hypothetical protein [Liquorilactobacillus satsumensis]|uniref:Uncharacterized protein n=2 Tax=Lactobacillaceae TaxID=33958 RepID=A0A0R1UVY2_9LACO|nr:hypothetical protein [Liquorilactobacillus satsumensis]KRL97420.1 hypothetical protein FD50_GL001400 [Liquorilactobacillus satsumensis DSM 16230 = JCM 12392]MCC7667272.1 hypothetical protein [Liquorilactobacillus satsumensis]MCP9357130.1 hypothetical protein [Liquorilactobacillus satsumensis]MCP9371077.1 hypothetical protein [Liquorilactobacillus satsumensis]
MSEEEKYFIYRIGICLEEALDVQKAELTDQDTLDDDFAMFKVIEELNRYVEEDSFIRHKLYHVYKQNLQV